MKAKRRHELQDNALAKQLETFPETLKRHASKIMLGITLVLVVVFIFRYRANAAAQKQILVDNALQTVRSGPSRLREMDYSVAMGERLSAERQSVINAITDSIATLNREAGTGDDDAPIRAEALLAQAELDWTLANLAPLPAATTRPTLALKRSSEEYLKSAENAYRDLISGYPKQTLQWVTAQFGLAAIAENRHDWKSAREIYTSLAQNKSIPEVFQLQAIVKLGNLGQIERPVMLSAYSSTQPTTAPSTTQPTTAPTTQP